MASSTTTSLERFVSLTTLTDRHFASHLCELLEETGISVVLEHVEVQGAYEAAETGYRVHVPMYRLQTARRIFSHAQDGQMFRTEAGFDTDAINESVLEQKFAS